MNIAAFSKVGLGFLVTAVLLGCNSSGTSSLATAPGSNPTQPTNPSTPTNPGPTTPTPPAVTPEDKKVTVVVAVIDSLMPEDIDPAVMPNVQALIDAGTFYKESRSVFSAETIPNHIAMMTGVYPDRNGIPTNNFWDKDLAGSDVEGEDLDNPNEITAKTLFTWIDEKCRQGTNPINPAIRTASVLSKTYLYEVFRGDANDAQPNDIGITNVEPDTNWEPSTSPGYIGPGSEHTPDNFTGPEAVSTLPDADFIFINLGDVDRSSHAGGSVPRLASRGTADQQIGNLITELRNTDRWETSVFILVSDHGMDFSDPTANPPSGPPEGQFNTTGLNSLVNSLSTQPLLDQLALPACGFEPMTAVQNGGTNSINVTNLNASATQKQDSLRAARACVLNFDGTNTASDTPASCETVVGTLCKAALVKPINLDAVKFAWYANPDLYNGSALAGTLAADTGGAMPASLKSRHENLGDLVLAIGDGFKFSEPDSSGNPIPGNHGHFPTIHNTLIVSGGFSSLLNAGNELTGTGNEDHFIRAADQSENIDVAATVAWVLGLGIEDSDFPDVSSTFPDYGDGVVRTGFDGRVLTEAFTTSVSPSVCGLIPGTAP